MIASPLPPPLKVGQVAAHVGVGAAAVAPGAAVPPVVAASPAAVQVNSASAVAPAATSSPGVGPQPEPEGGKREASASEPVAQVTTTAAAAAEAEEEAVATDTEGDKLSPREEADRKDGTAPLVQAHRASTPAEAPKMSQVQRSRPDDEQAEPRGEESGTKHQGRVESSSSQEWKEPRTTKAPQTVATTTMTTTPPQQDTSADVPTDQGSATRTHEQHPAAPATPPAAHDAPQPRKSPRQSGRGSRSGTDAESKAAENEARTESSSSSSSSSRLRIEPDHFYPLDPHDESSWQDTTGVPVFKPSMAQFADFEAFCEAVDSYGMQSGIVKVIPPKEWLDSLPPIKASQGAREGEAACGHGMRVSTLESVRIRNAITQRWEGAGSGVWRQANVVHPAKVWNAKQWAQLCASREKRGPELSRMKANAQRSREAAHPNDLSAATAGTATGDGGAAGGAEANRDEGQDDGVRTRSGRGRGAAAAAAAAAPPPSRKLAGDKRKRGDGEPKFVARSEARASTAPATPPPAPAATTTPEKSAHDGPEASVSGSPGSEGRKLRERPLVSPGGPSSPSAAVAPASAVPGTTAASGPAPSSASTGTRAAKPRAPRASELTTDAEWASFDHENAWLLEGLSELEQREVLQKYEGEEGDVGSTAAAAASVAGSDQDGVSEGKERARRLDELAGVSPSDWDAVTCREIEGEYWRGLNFGQPPMYGADLKGTLFPAEVTTWNVGNLPNLLTRLRLRRRLPGVTTPYLYWGMWRATFAWHLEDMDLYSINFIRFGAPKQWYAIRQCDRQRFETAMASAFPSDASRCKHFLRHKQYIASPAFLRSHNLRPVRLVQHAGEFVITYPYGYHSGFNLGYNCAESVNFALQSWIEIGRRAGWCECERDSVRMDVDAILEESEEMRERESRRREKLTSLATASATVRSGGGGGDKAEENVEGGAEGETKQRDVDEARRARRNELRRARRQNAKKLKLQQPQQPHEGGSGDVGEDGHVGGPAAANDGAPPAAKKPKREAFRPSSSVLAARSCAFCPAKFQEGLLPVARSRPGQPPRFAHADCAHFTPECWFEADGSGGGDVVMGFDKLPKQRMALRCSLCADPKLQKSGVKVQCTFGKCVRAVHVSCAKVPGCGWYLANTSSADADKLQGTTKASQEELLELMDRLQRDLEQPDAAATAAAGKASDVPVPPAPLDTQVVLCPQHNARQKVEQERRRLRVLRKCAERLKSGDQVRVRLNGNGAAVWQMTVVRVRGLRARRGEDAEREDDGGAADDAAEAGDEAEGTVVVQEGFNVSEHKWSKVLFDDKVRAGALNDVEAEEAEEERERQDKERKLLEASLAESARLHAEQQQLLKRADGGGAASGAQSEGQAKTKKNKSGGVEADGAAGAAPRKKVKAKDDGAGQEEGQAKAKKQRRKPQSKGSSEVADAAIPPAQTAPPPSSSSSTGVGSFYPYMPQHLPGQAPATLPSHNAFLPHGHEAGAVASTAPRVAHPTSASSYASTSPALSHTSTASRLPYRYQPFDSAPLQQQYQQRSMYPGSSPAAQHMLKGRFEAASGPFAVASPSTNYAPTAATKAGQAYGADAKSASPQVPEMQYLAPSNGHGHGHCAPSPSSSLSSPSMASSASPMMAAPHHRGAPSWAQPTGAPAHHAYYSSAAAQVPSPLAQSAAAVKVSKYGAAYPYDSANGAVAASAPAASPFDGAPTYASGAADGHAPGAPYRQSQAPQLPYVPSSSSSPSQYLGATYSAAAPHRHAVAPYYHPQSYPHPYHHQHPQQQQGQGQQQYAFGAPPAFDAATYLPFPQQLQPQQQHDVQQYRAHHAQHHHAHRH